VNNVSEVPILRHQAAIKLVLACSLLEGCITPHTTHFPSLSFMPSEYERREAQIHDPYPDADSGPDTATRPRNFQQRPETLRAQDKHFAALKRLQSGAPFPILDTKPRSTGAKYRNVVPR